jgi:hypothetical protein
MIGQRRMSSQPEASQAKWSLDEAGARNTAKL